MGQLYANNAVTSLTTPITAGSTTISLADPSRFPQPSNPTDFFLITVQEGVNYEVVRCEARSGANCTSLTRGYDGTTAQSFTTSATVYVGIPSAILQNIRRKPLTGATNTWL